MAFGRREEAPSCRRPGTRPSGARPFPVAPLIRGGDGIVLPDRFITAGLQADPAHLLFYRVRGDAMAPTVGPGDLVLVVLMMNATVVMGAEGACLSQAGLEVADSDTGIDAADLASGAGGKPFSDDQPVTIDSAAEHESRDEEELAVENSGAQPASGEEYAQRIQPVLPSWPSSNAVVAEDLSRGDEEAIEDGALLDQNGNPIEGTGGSPTLIP